MARTPYKELPDTAFWKRSVANIVAADVDPSGKTPFKIATDDKVMSAGSCFAQHISRYLQQGGFNALVTETPHEILTPEIAKAWNYGVYTARYGNIYTPRQLQQLFQRAYGTFIPKENIWVDGDHVIDPFRPQIQPNGFASHRELELDRQQHFAAVRKAFEELDVFVFTFGLTESWVSKEDGAVFPLCPGVSGGTFDPTIHGFHNFTVEEITGDMEAYISDLRSVNPSAKIILTVSPVPLVATASGHHVLAATTLSKAVLRVACQILSDTVENLYYFPSYEIVTGAHNRLAYFEDDLRTVKDDGVANVMRIFFQRMTEGNTTRAESQKVRMIAESEEALKLVCEEETLDTVAGSRL